MENNDIKRNYIIGYIHPYTRRWTVIFSGFYPRRYVEMRKKALQKYYSNKLQIRCE